MFRSGLGRRMPSYPTRQLRLLCTASDARSVPPAPPAAAPPLRLNKLLSQQHECSRREADAWIKKGWVRVDGEAAELGQKVAESDSVLVSRRALHSIERSVTILLNKPKTYVSQSPGPRRRNQRHAIDLLIGSKHKFGGRDARDLPKMACAGRLDAESTGLLVFTQNGALARALVAAQDTIEKEYLVRVEPMASADSASAAVAGRWRGAKPPAFADVGARRAVAAEGAAEEDGTENEREEEARPLFEALPLVLDATVQEALRARLSGGLTLDGKALRPAKVDWLEDGLLRFVLNEGRYRQIRRMCAMVGLGGCYDL